MRHRQKLELPHVSLEGGVSLALQHNKHQLQVPNTVFPNSIPYYLP
jgi:hypothetical protein